jgi:hypothetical protein
MNRDKELVAEQMRARNAAAYIREGKPGWQRRRGQIEARERRRLKAEVDQRFEQLQTRTAEAAFDAKNGTTPYRAHKSETDSGSREQRLIGGAVAEGKLRREAKALIRNGIKLTEITHASVQKATAEQLINAGWGSYERYLIPADWQTRRPNTEYPLTGAAKRASVARNGTNPPDTTQ